MTFGIMTPNLMGLSVTLSISMLCHYAKCRILFTVMLNVVGQIYYLPTQLQYSTFGNLTGPQGYEGADIHKAP